MINVAVAGAAGRMGQMISNNILNAEDMNLSAAFDLHRVGDDIGTIISQNKCGVPITHPDNMKDVLKQTST
ncbi:MAG: 4-hydroxy-tetrahydrodipicolinate reductase, partial [Methanosarcinales archaeon]|nr:4-hydroxy-tetrahydrodipicolinate reductase [Methanosarcinales archaeon]